MRWIEFEFPILPGPFLFNEFLFFEFNGAPTNCQLSSLTHTHTHTHYTYTPCNIRARDSLSHTITIQQRTCTHTKTRGCAVKDVSTSTDPLSGLFRLFFLPFTPVSVCVCVRAQPPCTLPPSILAPPTTYTTYKGGGMRRKRKGGSGVGWPATGFQCATVPLRNFFFSLFSSRLFKFVFFLIFLDFVF